MTYLYSLYALVQETGRTEKKKNNNNNNNKTKQNIKLASVKWMVIRKKIVVLPSDLT